MIVYALWVVMLMDPQWLLKTVIGSIATRAPTPFYFVIGIAALMRGPRKEQWVPQILILMLWIAATTPTSYNIGRSIVVLRAFLIFWLLAIGTLGIIKTPKRTIPLILILMLWQYLWWGVHGFRSGLVSWDYINDNYDGYGPLMSGGTAAGVFAGLAIKKGKLKWLAFFTAALSLIALMSSFARGAALAGLAVIAVSWLRSPRKGAMTLGLLAAAGIVVGLSLTVFSNISRGDAKSNYFAEMATITEKGTASDREIIWGAARQLFQSHPILGVGADAFGPAAAATFEVGDLAGDYSANPAVIYSKALHNVYYQVLSELGIVGFAILMWILFDFYIKNSRLRTPAYRRAWQESTGGTIDLQYVALGLEGMLVSWAAGAYFYNLLFVPWFYGTLVVNLVVYRTLTQWIAANPQPAAPATRQPRPLLRRKPATNAALVMPRRQH